MVGPSKVTEMDVTLIRAKTPETPENGKPPGKSSDHDKTLPVETESRARHELCI